MSVRANDLRRRAVVRCSMVMLLFVVATSIPGHDRTSLVYASIDSSTYPQVLTGNSTSYRHRRNDNPNNLNGSKSTSTHPTLPATLAATPAYANLVNRSSHNAIPQSVLQGCEYVGANASVKIGPGGTSDDTQGNFVKFAILLPAKSNNPRDVRILSTVLPVIEMAKRNVTGPGGLLQNLRIEIDHRDTQCSSTYGALGAFDIFLKRKPGDAK